jgi:hypothetical protein
MSERRLSLLLSQLQLRCVLNRHVCLLRLVLHEQLRVLRSITADIPTFDGNQKFATIFTKADTSTMLQHSITLCRSGFWYDFSCLRETSIDVTLLLFAYIQFIFQSNWPISGVEVNHLLSW